MTAFTPDPSWNIGLEDLKASPLRVHTMMGTVPCTQVSEYHLAFANIELKRPLGYYEERVRAIDFRQKERVLDAACGVGQWSLALARSNNEVHGIDLSPERLAIAEALMARNDVKNAFFTQGNLEVLPFTDQFFDAVFCYGVFMFLDPTVAMKEFTRVLKPGGKLYICANGLGWSLSLIMKRRLVRSGLRTIKRTVKKEVRDNFLTKGGMRRSCRAAGLELTAWAGEGKLRLCPNGVPGFEPVYVSRFLGFTAVFEMVATKTPAKGSGQDRQEGGNAETAAPPTDVKALLARGQDFNRRRVPGKEVTSVSHDTYPSDELAALRAKWEEVDTEGYLNTLVHQLIGGCSGEQEKVERIITFVQGAIFHNPLVQPPVSLTSFEILQWGEGRCGHVAKLTVDLLRRAGFSARTRQFDRHIIAEVFLDKEWRIVDGDAFKNGVIPKNKHGQILSFKDLEENPYQLDRFPPTGLWIRKGSRYTRNLAGIEVDGYVDAVNQEDRGYLSGLYCRWIPRECPPSVPQLPKLPAHKVCPAEVTLLWPPSTDRDSDLRGYRVRVGATSKGYTYNNVTYDRILNQTGVEVGQFETTDANLRVWIDRPGRYYWSVQAIDDHILKEPETFYWSSDEDSFQVG